MTLRVGQIDYANCIPIFTTLRNTCNCAAYEFIKGVPANLNRMLASGEIEVCPSSSIEYGKFPERYYLLPELSISSLNEVKSVFLFSRVPIEELNGKCIGLTTESDTSVNLLKIIMKKKFGYDNVFQRTELPLSIGMQSFDAMLLIGDAALKGKFFNSEFHVFDLGELWQRFTGLPFVFALWIVNYRAVEQKYAEVKGLFADLMYVKSIFRDTLKQIAASSNDYGWLGQDGLLDYWKTLSYDLSQLHLQGLQTYYRYATDLGILPVEPKLRFIE